MASRDVYDVNNQPVPATEEQKWTRVQLEVLDEISSRPEFDYWVKMALTQVGYETNWTRGVRTVLYYDRKGVLHAVSIGVNGTLGEVSSRG